MTVRPLSHQLLSWMPGVLALVLILLAAAPMQGGLISYTPNVAWLMTLVMVAFYPTSWPRGLAFGFGLLQDLLFATPLGLQALLTLLLVQLAAIQSQRQQTMLFRMRWMEAAGTLLMWHLLLWALLHLLVPNSASLAGLIRAGIVNALWYPIFYWFGTRLFAALPDVK